MNIVINNTSMQPIYEQIVDQVKQLILTGRIAEHDPLPSVRSLARIFASVHLLLKKLTILWKKPDLSLQFMAKGALLLPLIENWQGKRP